MNVPSVAEYLRGCRLIKAFLYKAREGESVAWNLGEYSMQQARSYFLQVVRVMAR